MKKKLIIFLPSFSDGGAEEVIINIANYLYKKREIIFIVNKNFGKKKRLLNKKIKIIELKRISLIFSIFEITSIIKKINPDCVLTTLTHSNIFLCLVKFFSNYKFRLIIRETNIFLKKKLSMGNYLKMFFFQLLKKFLYNQSNYVLAINSYSKKQLIEIGIDKNKLLIVNNPILNNMNFKTIKNESKNKFILYLGRLVKHKNVDKIITDFHNILLFNKNYKLYIIGIGPELEYLKLLVGEFKLKNKVKFLGYIHNPDQYIKKTNLIISYSDFEGQPNSIIKAAAYGKNILLKKYDGILKNFKNKKNIQIFDNFTKKETQLFIERCLKKKLKIKKNKEIVDNFSTMKNMKIYERIFFEKN